MNNEFIVEVCSDLDYEDMVADISFRNLPFAMITQEKGVNHMKIQIFSKKDGEILWKFHLEDFLHHISFAKDQLIKMAAYSNKNLGQELKTHLKNGYNIIEISRWAYGILYDYRECLSTKLKDVLKDLARMEDDQQFEYTEEEIKLLAELLITQADDPLRDLEKIKKIKDDTF